MFGSSPMTRPCVSWISSNGLPSNAMNGYSWPALAVRNKPVLRLRMPTQRVMNMLMGFCSSMTLFTTSSIFAGSSSRIATERTVVLPAIMNSAAAIPLSDTSPMTSARCSWSGIRKKS